MGRQTSFAHQRQVLEDLASKLSLLENSLIELAQKYERDVTALHEEQGLMDEVYMEYRDKHLSAIKAGLEELAANIVAKNIPFVEKELDFIASREEFI